MPDIQTNTIGPWTRHELLGQGGNATVWRATSVDHPQGVALKILNETDAGGEAYQRFTREVQFLREKGTITGVLPLIDAYLPEHPRKRDRAWLAMPIATPLERGLSSAPLPEIVRAVTVIADTMWALQRDFGIAHRDIKPGNLYELDGQILIGDFGLISVPDAESLTGNGRQVGPAHYTAYEMISDPATADPHPADVFSLGKTLWVLATGQRFPPEGHQRAGERGFEIGQYRPHARASDLDREVDRMTALQPDGRPTKEQVARDLAAWSELAEALPILDVSTARQLMLTKIAKALDENDAAERYKDLALGAVRRLQELTAPLNAQLKSLPGAEIDSMTDELTRNILKGYFHGRRVIFDWRRCTLVAPLSGPMDLVLRMARAVELLDDGTLYAHFLVMVSPQRTMGSKFHWQPQPPLSAPVGSIEGTRMLEEAVEQMAPQVDRALTILVENLPDFNEPEQ